MITPALIATLIFGSYLWRYTIDRFIKGLSDEQSMRSARQDAIFTAFAGLVISAIDIYQRK